MQVRNGLVTIYNGIQDTGNVIVTGSITATQGFSGSLNGTSSYAILAATASYATNVPETASYALFAETTPIIVRQVVEFTSSIAQTTFSSSYIPGTIDVFVSGSRLNSTQYTASDGQNVVIPNENLVQGESVVIVKNEKGVFANASRGAFSYTTSNLSYDQTENGTLQGYPTYVLLNVSTSNAAWVRIYTDGTSRTNDASRNIDTDPLPGTGVIAEVITSGSYTQKISPFVFGGNYDTPTNNNVYLAITNKFTGSAIPITVTLSLLPLQV
jgi:hypothetical protein